MKSQSEGKKVSFVGLLPWCKRYCKNHNLEYLKLSEWQHRVKNNETGKYVDFWNTGSCRDSKGIFHRIGATKRGGGLNNIDWYGTWNYEIKQEIKLLVKPKL